VLVVTEPTLSGLHDMKRVLDTAAHFNIPALVCVNKYDINPENTAQIQQECSRRDVSVAGLIPYNKEVTQAMIHKKAVVEHQCGFVADVVRSVWHNTMAALNV